MASPPTDGQPFEGSDYEPPAKGLEYYMGPHAYGGMRGVGNMAAWALENLVPGTSDAASLRDAIGSSRGIVPAMSQRRWGEAGLKTGETMANALGVLPGLPALGGIIAGRKARWGVDPRDFDRAEEMLGNSLADPAGKIPASVREQIFKETGAYRGPEGAWRKEIIDDPARVALRTPGHTGTAELSELLDHPDLFKAYPMLKDALVESVPGRVGGWSERTNTMQIGSGLKPPERLSVFLHESQHGVQGVNNFSRGGNPLSMEFVPGGMRHVDMGSTADMPSFETFKKILSGASKRGTPDDSVLRGKYEDYLDQMRRAGRAGRDLRTEPYTLPERLEGYKRLYGEAEARMMESAFADRLAGRVPKPAFRGFDRPEELLTRLMPEDISRTPGSFARSRPEVPQRKDWDKIALDRLLRDIRDPRGTEELARIQDIGKPMVRVKPTKLEQR